jgi:hypothetical protein
VASVTIGTVDLPERMDREKYFRVFSYLELSALFAGPLEKKTLAKWPKGKLGLVAPFSLTHRKPPANARWAHDATSGDFRDSAPGRVALAAFREAIATVEATHAIFRSPTLFAPSAANRELLTRFFGEVATEEAVGVPRVWVPDGLWEPRAAVAFATELGVACAIDPLVVDPNTPFEAYDDLEAPALYFRVSGLGRGGAIRSEKLDELAALCESYEDVPITVAFDSSARWADARNFTKVLAPIGSSAAAESPDAEADAEEDLEDEG